MFQFWPTIVEPLLRLQKPDVIVEVGSEAGLNLSRIMDFAMANGSTVHAIDPKPLFDVMDWTRRAGKRLVVHCDLSLKVIPKLAPFDTIFLDGDHNWYTVFHELKAVQKRTAELNQPFPLVLLHDVGWPWGRRDLYYAPETIPPEFRRPHTRPNAQAAGQGSFHGNFSTATQEGGPRNGVLTGIEDFLKESPQPIDLFKLPGFAGLAILAPRALQERNPPLAAFLKGLEMSPTIAAYIEALEAARWGRPDPAATRANTLATGARPAR